MGAAAGAVEVEEERCLRAPEVAAPLAVISVPSALPLAFSASAPHVPVSWREVLVQ